MFFSEETYRAVIVATIQAQGSNTDTPSIIKETVDALIAADQKLISAYGEIRACLQAQQEKA